MKIICVGMLKVTGNVDKLRLSPLFNLLLDNMALLNQGTLLTSYQSFKNIANDNRDKVEKLEATLASSKIDADILLLLFLFISFKKELQKNDFDLKSISIDVKEIKSIYKKELSQALYLVGYTMSMGALHESIHRLSFSPLFETVKEKLIIDKELSVDEITPESSSQLDIKYDSVDVEHNKTEVSNQQNYIENEKPDCLDISYNSPDMNVGVPELFSDSSLETIEDSEREKLLKELNNKMKGNLRKKALELVDSLHREDLKFSYESLEEKIMSNKEFLKKNGSPVKAVQSLLDIFIPIKRK
jgi:hypothetical protein